MDSWHSFKRLSRHRPGFRRVRCAVPSNQKSTRESPGRSASLQRSDPQRMDVVSKGRENIQAARHRALCTSPSRCVQSPRSNGPLSSCVCSDCLTWRRPPSAINPLHRGAGSLIRYPPFALTLTKPWCSIFTGIQYVAHRFRFVFAGVSADRYFDFFLQHVVYPDGRKRSRPPSSTVHGWLVKWRGTFSGNESLRSQGIREMREAAARRKYYKENPTSKPHAPSSGGFPFFRKSRPTGSSRRSNTLSRGSEPLSRSKSAPPTRSKSGSSRPSNAPHRSNTTGHGSRTRTSHRSGGGGNVHRSGGPSRRPSRPALQRGDTSRRSRR
jgi:hypothetical protein